jgi:eukaryotic-like serine/threonine-protein kinase
MNRGVDWSRIKDLFGQALDQPPELRDAWIEQACAGDAATLAEVRSLLAARAAPDRIAGGVAQLLSPLAEDEKSAPDAGTQVGAYRLLRPLGVGGMGRVYLAERADGQFTHHVALKLIRNELAVPELIQRFLRERDTLARLAHPNIAQLHDGGVAADGAPYFTLEYVDGEPITDWCDVHRLDIRSRVSLLLKVCDAVEHAHHNLIVHRDIKPSNILVTAAGEPKLLDFGIAKPLEVTGTELTGTQARPMTREYAAPEQILGDPITTATDVYSLGVLLYLLLSGRMPYRRAALGQTSWAKAILEEQPEPLDRAVTRTVADPAAKEPDAFLPHASSALDPDALAAARATTALGLRRALRGDLERIAQRAIAKSPATRYTTVGALAYDLRAYLDGRAISGGTRTYRLRKFVRRYWLPLGAAAALLIVIVGGALIVAADARQIAREAQTTTAVKEFLVGLFRAADPMQNNGKEITARELVERGASRITDVHDQPQLRGELENVLGEINNDIKQFKEGARLEHLAVADLTASGAKQSLIADSELEQARALGEDGDYAEAARLARQATERLRKLNAPSSAELARGLALQAYFAVAMHKFDDAAPLAAEGLSFARRSDVPKDVLAETLAVAAQVASAKRDYAANESLLREALVVRRSIGGAHDPAVATALNELANSLFLRSKLSEALKLQTEAITIASATLGEHDPRLGDMRADYADALRVFGRFPEADEQQTLAENFYAEYPESEPIHISLLNRRINLLFFEGRFSEAEQASRDLAKLNEKVFGPHSPLGPQLKSMLSQIHAAQGRLDEAAKEIGEVVKAETDAGKPTARHLWFQGNIEQLGGNYGDAETHIRTALAMEQSAHGQGTYEASAIQTLLGITLHKAGRDAEAEPILRDALASYARMTADVVIPASARANYALAEVLAQRPEVRAEALDHAQTAAKASVGFYGLDSQQSRDAAALTARLQEKGK